MTKRLSGCLAAAVMLAAVLLAVMAAPARATEAEVKAALDMAPADAPIVLVVPNAARASKKIANLGQALGVNSPEMSDLLGTIKKQTGMAAGVRDDGPVLLAAVDAQAYRDRIAGTQGNEQQQPPFIAAIPITDFKLFIDNFPGHSGDTVVTIKMGEQGQEMYVVQSGGFAVLSADKQRVAAYKPAHDSGRWITGMGKPAARCVDSSDALVLINVEQLAPALQPKIKEIMDMVMGNMDQAAIAPGADAASMAWFKTMATIYGDVATALVRDTSIYTEAVDLSDRGIGGTVAVQLKAGSKTAALFPGGGGSNEILSRLPNDNYLLAMAASAKGIDINILATNLLAELSANPDDSMAAAVRPSVENFRRLQAMAEVMYAPAPGKPMGQGGLVNAATVALTDDAQAWIKANRQAIEKMGKLHTPPAGAGANPGANPEANPEANPGATLMGGLSISTQYTEKALRIDGVDVDQYQVSVTFPPAMIQENKMLGILQMLGMTNQTGYICASGNYVITTTSPDPALVKRTLAAVKEQTGIGAAPLLVQTRKEGLSSDPAGQLYFNLYGVGSLVNMIIPMFGMPAIQLPNDLPPVGMGLTVDQGALAGRWFVPMPVIKAVKQAINQFQPPGQPRAPRPAGGDGGPPAPPM